VKGRCAVGRRAAACIFAGSSCTGLILLNPHALCLGSPLTHSHNCQDPTAPAPTATHFPDQRLSTSMQHRGSDTICKTTLHVHLNHASSVLPLGPDDLPWLLLSCSSFCYL
jgi:hypothetical protein